MLLMKSLFDRIQFSLVYDSLDGKIKRSDNDKVKDNSPDNYPGDGFPYLRFKNQEQLQ